MIVAPLTLNGGLAILRKTGPGQVAGRLDAEQAHFMTHALRLDPAPGEEPVAAIPRFDGPVWQDAARLWDSVEAAWQSWQRYGQPERTRIGITARGDGEQFAWLDDPDGPPRVAAALPVTATGARVSPPVVRLHGAVTVTAVGSRLGARRVAGAARRWASV